MSFASEIPSVFRLESPVFVRGVGNPSSGIFSSPLLTLHHSPILPPLFFQIFFILLASKAKEQAYSKAYILMTW